MKVLDEQRESAMEKETGKATRYVCVLNLLKTTNGQVWRRKSEKWGEGGLGKCRRSNNCGSGGVVVW